MVVATILIIGTVFGISALVSSVYEMDGAAAAHASSVWHQHVELKRSGAKSPLPGKVL